MIGRVLTGLPGEIKALRPARRAQDAVPISLFWLTHRRYEWVFEADITARLERHHTAPLSDCHDRNRVFRFGYPNTQALRMVRVRMGLEHCTQLTTESHIACP